MPHHSTAWIIGSGGQAKVIASFLPHTTIRHLVERGGGPGDRLQSDFFSDPDPEPADYFIAIGENGARRRYFDRLKAMNITPASCIAPTAWVASTAHIGNGVFIGAGTVIGAGARIADNVIVNNLSLVDHDSKIGEDSQITVGVMVGAEVVIGRRCFLGMKSCVISRVDLGDDVFLMAGAVVVRSVPSGARLGGVPASLIPNK